MNDEEKMKRLELLRKPFPDHQISLLPKPYKKDSPKGNCPECGGYHPLPAMHLKYVGHAALTDRLLDVDPFWSWEPLSYDENGLPRFDSTGGLWIKLTILGVTRLGYGHAESKTYQDIGAREKEVIGDCLARGTLITTNRGEVEIQDVKIGDLVPTRGGWRPVIDVWMSHSSAPVWEVTLESGKKVTGTPHHRVPTIRGFSTIGWLNTSSTDHMLSFTDGLFVADKVLKVVEAGETEVWDISVGTVHEYVANGVLVCNCIRNGAMRFGAALDLWHKGDLHGDDKDKEDDPILLLSLREAAMNGKDALQKAFSEMPASPEKTAIWAAHGAALKEAAFKADKLIGGKE